MIHRHLSFGSRLGATTLALLAAAALLGGCREQPSSQPPVHLNPNMDDQLYYEAQEPSALTESGRAMLIPPEHTVAAGFNLYGQSVIADFDAAHDPGGIYRHNPVDFDADWLADDPAYDRGLLVNASGAVRPGPRVPEPASCAVDRDCWGADGSNTLLMCHEGACHEKRYIDALPQVLISALSDSNGKPSRERMSAFLERGQQRFNIYCAPCHGESGGTYPPAPTAQPWEPDELQSMQACAVKVEVDANADADARARAEADAIARADASCGAGLACIDGVCLRPCAEDAQCIQASTPAQLLLCNRAAPSPHCSPAPSTAPASAGAGIIHARGFINTLPGYHDDQRRSYELGQIYDIITNGRATMKPYRMQVPTRDRWAIALYVRALQRSRYLDQDHPLVQRDQANPR